MAVDLKIKSNSKQVSKKFKKFQSVLPRIIDKGIKQAGFYVLVGAAMPKVLIEAGFITNKSEAKLLKYPKK